ncbi:MAG: hypothetical protein B7Z75_11655 [Acidocella sp. 20-57-95]|nr:MAG: hypothetical protein B7Z75_11655 [Acidocella sp. 20-57-95]OYV62677.1 MAG: hypothetical protein B7Z71_00355 [Acidocella sp. 21-58-7]HQT63144.1 tripartite tricarboxylate transporter TctB family protein [Acidocella sp.]HQU03336.1 tripartite tricarboxylate transporter TctB family protein [Acidocella sp.]
MLFITRLKQMGPYLIVLAVAVALYVVANQIAYSQMPDQIGPDEWPKIILTLLMLVCCFEIGQQLLFAARNEQRRAAAPPVIDPDEMLVETHANNTILVVAVIVLTASYLYLMPICGFFLCTLFYLGIFMWLCSVRQPLVLVSVSAVLTVFFTYTFMKIIFVPLPIGVPPFSVVSLHVMALLGIR